MGPHRARLGFATLVDMKRLEPMEPSHDQDALKPGAEQCAVGEPMPGIVAAQMWVARFNLLPPLGHPVTFD